MTDKKPAIAEYPRWLADKHKCDPTTLHAYYDAVSIKAKADLEKGSFWTELNRQIREFDDQYRVASGFPLQMYPKPLEVLVKPYDSFLLKTFRKNVMENKNWPSHPESGWLLPNACFAKINDMLRTLVVIKYLDGIQFFVNKLKSFCDGQRVECHTYFEARNDGYYAAHSYVKQTFEIPRATWDTERVEITIEIQATTQLQDAIRKLLHTYYEDRRKRIQISDKKWQWDYGSDEFEANYLGHILHYIEGKIVEIREKQKRGLE
jgi:hypothetical protein